MDPSARNKQLMVELLKTAVSLGGAILAMKMCFKYLDPYREQREAAKRRAAAVAKRLGKSLKLNEYEELLCVGAGHAVPSQRWWLLDSSGKALAALNANLARLLPPQLLAVNVLNPRTIDVSLDDVSGMDDIVQEMELKVLAPMMEPQLYSTTLLRQTKGVLLYGPPGTGKTMLAKALARRSSCFFLNITASALISKWLGDSNKLIRAVFTLAHKLQPCIIFIDEVDALLGKRGSFSEHEATLQAKTEFMQMWDGMESCRGHVVVMGATNRPYQVDEAVLRRFSLQYEVGLPKLEQRIAILKHYINKHHMEMATSTAGRAVEEALVRNTPTPATGGLNSMDWVASRTEGFSGSDLAELCSQAAQQCLTDYWQQRWAAERNGERPTSIAPRLRPLVLNDFVTVLQHMRPSTQQAEEYRVASSGAAGGRGGSAVGVQEMMELLKALIASKGSTAGSNGSNGGSNGANGSSNSTGSNNGNGVGKH